MNERSDLDVALLLPHSWSERERLWAATQFQVGLSRLFGRGDIDVVVANDAPLMLHHRITRERDILFGREARERVFLDWSTWRDYRDMEPFFRIGHAAVLRRAREGRFGVRSGRSHPATP